MLRISKMADYATVLMQSISEHDGAISACQLAAAISLALPTVRKILKQLLAAGLLQSSRGAGGGYLLAQPAAEISLAAIVEAIDGPIAVVDCAHPSKGCDRSGHCTMAPHWQTINYIIKNALLEVKLSSSNHSSIQQLVSNQKLEMAGPYGT